MKMNNRIQDILQRRRDKLLKSNIVNECIQFKYIHMWPGNPQSKKKYSFFTKMFLVQIFCPDFYWGTLGMDRQRVPKKLDSSTTQNQSKTTF